MLLSGVLLQMGRCKAFGLIESPINLFIIMLQDVDELIICTWSDMKYVNGPMPYRRSQAGFEVYTQA